MSSSCVFWKDTPVTGPPRVESKWETFVRTCGGRRSYLSSLEMSRQCPRGIVSDDGLVIVETVKEDLPKFKEWCGFTKFGHPSPLLNSQRG